MQTHGQKTTSFLGILPLVFVVCFIGSFPLSVFLLFSYSLTISYVYIKYFGGSHSPHDCLLLLSCSPIIPFLHSCPVVCVCVRARVSVRVCVSH